MFSSQATEFTDLIKIYVDILKLHCKYKRIARK